MQGKNLTTKFRRSPLFYVGDKYKLLPNILDLFPEEIERYFEPFLGGGSVFLNVHAKEYYLNDIDSMIVMLHQFLIRQSGHPELLIKKIQEKINEYGFSRSYLEDIVPADLKLRWKKTYYAHFNNEPYQRMKKDFNNMRKKNPLTLYLLLIYGFNHMIRFNKKGEFNLPVGNVDFNKNVSRALSDYSECIVGKKILLSSQDYVDFLNEQKFRENDFIYFDPPYLIGASEYNKLWSSSREKELLSILDNFNKHGIKFALSNVISYRGKSNNILIEWAKTYNIHNIKSNYISYHDNAKKAIKEVLITNYA